MEKRSKYALIGVIALCAVYGFCAVLNRCGSGANSARDSEYEKRALRLADELSSAERDIEDARGRTHTSRTAITGSLAALEQSRSGINESLSRIGKVGGGFATIEECISASESSVERLTARVQCIERIIQEAAERESRMDDGNSDAGSCDNRLYDCRDSKE